MTADFSPWKSWRASLGSLTAKIQHGQIEGVAGFPEPPLPRSTGTAARSQLRVAPSEGGCPERLQPVRASMGLLVMGAIFSRAANASEVLPASDHRRIC